MCHMIVVVWIHRKKRAYLDSVFLVMSCDNAITDFDIFIPLLLLLLEQFFTIV
jgi:hypothetical protein